MNQRMGSAPTDAEPSRAWALARLILGQVFLHGSMAGMRMAAPLLALREGYSALAVGVLLALFSVSQVFLAIPAGRYADRHGLLKPMRLGVVAAVLGGALAGVVPHFAMLCISALLMGGATGVAIVALQRHVGRAAQDTTELKQVFSWLAIGPAVSNFLGPVAAGLLIDHAGLWVGGAAGDTNGFRAAFLLMAVMPLLTWFWVRHTQELPPVEQVAGSTQSKIWDLLRDPQMRRLLMVNWLLSSCWDVHTFVVPMLGHERGFSASVIGVLLGCMAVSGAVVRVILPLVAAHLREWVVVTGAMIATALLFAVYPLVQSPWTMGLCSVLLGLSLGSVQPMILSTLHQITPQALHGQAIGLRLMTLNLSSVLMPMLFGTAGLVVGVSVVFWTVGAMVGAGAPLAWRMRPVAPGDETH